MLLHGIRRFPFLSALGDGTLFDVVRGASRVLSGAQLPPPAFDSFDAQPHAVTHIFKAEPAAPELPHPSTYDLQTAEGRRAYKRDRGLTSLEGDQIYRREKRRQKAPPNTPLWEQKNAKNREKRQMRKQKVLPEGEPLPPRSDAPTAKGVRVHRWQFETMQEYQQAYKAERNKYPNFKLEAKRKMQAKRQRQKASAATPSEGSSTASSTGISWTSTSQASAIRENPFVHQTSPPAAWKNVPEAAFAPLSPRLRSSDQDLLDYVKQHLLSDSP